MTGMQFINDSLAAIAIVGGIVILAVLWVAAISAAAVLQRRQAVINVQQAATQITVAAASLSETAAR